MPFWLKLWFIKLIKASRLPRYASIGASAPIILDDGPHFGEPRRRAGQHPE